MTDKQEIKVRRNAYKYYDEVIYEKQDLSKQDVALSSFYAGAKYALANKHDELNEQSRNIVQFLKDNGVYDMFWDNLFNQKTQEEIIHYLKYYFGTSLTFLEAFGWAGTQEGLDFWNELSDKWQKLF